MDINYSFVDVPMEGASVDNDVYPRAANICCAISCSLSIVGGSIIFGTFAAIPEIRNFTRKLIVCLTLADFLTATGILVGMIQTTLDNNHNVCVVQSFVTTYSTLVSFFLTMAIMLHLCVTVFSTSNSEYKRRCICYVLVSLIVPGILVGIACSAGALGSTKTEGTGPWCWIDSDHRDHVMWQLVTGKGWEILCYLVTVSYYVLLKLYLHMKHQHKTFNTIHTSLRDEDKNFLYVWFIFYSIRIWGTIRFLILVIDPGSAHETYMKVLLYLQSFGDPLQAFCNCILFCFLDKTVRVKLFSWCRNNRRYSALNSNERHAPLHNQQNTESTDRLLKDGHYIRYDGISYNQKSSSRNIGSDGFVSPTEEFISPHDGGFEDPHNFSYISPMSTPCHTPRLSPDSFTSMMSYYTDLE